MERVAVDRPSARRVQTVLVRSRRTAPVVRGVFAEGTSGASATALGAGDVFLVGDREPTGQSDGGGFGPPPPSVPFLAPGEGGGVPRFTSTGTGGGGDGDGDEPTLIEEATCGARDALGEAGTPLEPACSGPAPAPEQRGTLGQVVGGTVTTVRGVTQSVTGTVTTVTGTLGLGDGGGEVLLKRSGR